VLQREAWKEPQLLPLSELQKRTLNVPEETHAEHAIHCVTVTIAVDSLELCAKHLAATPKNQSVQQPALHQLSKQTQLEHACQTPKSWNVYVPSTTAPTHAGVERVAHNQRVTRSMLASLALAMTPLRGPAFGRA
jgi:hypothetical protein